MHGCSAGRTRTPRRIVINLLLVALMSSFAGCTCLREWCRNGHKVGPNYNKPPAPVADHWIDAADQRVNSVTADLRTWWIVFNDPVLNSLVEESSRQNITLREAGFRILQARAMLGIAVGEIFPQRQQATGSFAAIGQSVSNANAQFIPQRFYNQWNFGFNLAWELDFWGRFRRAVEAREAELNASIENYDDVLVTMIGDVADNYVQMRTFQQQLEYTRENARLQRETFNIADAKFNGGLTSELDVDQAQATLSQTESQIPQIEIAVRLAQNRLCVLLGIPPIELHDRVGAGGIPVAPVQVAAGIPADLLRRRPDVRRQERLAAAQSAVIGIAESDFYPHIFLNGQFGYSAAQFNDLFSGRALYGNVGPAFQWNLLNYGRIANAVRYEDAKFQELVATYQQTVLLAAEEVENGLITFLRSQQQARYLAESVRASQRAVDVSIAQYKGGLVDFNRVALLQQNLVTQQDQYARARGNIAGGLIDTYRALGGGWQIRLGGPPVMLPTPLPQNDPALNGQVIEKPEALLDDKQQPAGPAVPEPLPMPEIRQ